MAKTKIYGNKKTKVFHSGAKKDACRMSEIKIENRVKFKDMETAEAAGYRGCKLCFRTQGYLE